MLMEAYIILLLVNDTNMYIQIADTYRYIYRQTDRCNNTDTYETEYIQLKQFDRLYYN